MKVSQETTNKIIQDDPIDLSMASQEILLFLGSLKTFPEVVIELPLLGSNHQGKEEKVIYMVSLQSCISHSSRFTSWDVDSHMLWPVIHSFSRQSVMKTESPLVNSAGPGH